MTLLYACNAFAGDVAHKDCRCRANDKEYSQGAVLCLFGKLARCEMNLNNSTWKIVAQTCPQAKVRYPFSPIALSAVAGGSVKPF
jgi:hypothetical protein